MNSFFKSGLISLGIAVLILVLLEGLLRAVLPGNFLPLPPKQIREPAFEPHPDYIVELKPDVEKTYTHTQNKKKTEITWRSNSQGFRGPELKQNPDIRIMVYGDSNIQARFSTLEQTYPFQLQKQLSTQLPGKNIEVINAGLVGAGPDQNYLRLKQHQQTLKPDLVVFSLFADNDYGDLIRNNLFRLENDQLVASKHTLVTDSFLKVGEHSLLSRFYLVKFLLDLQNKLQYPTPEASSANNNQIVTNLLWQANMKEFSDYKKNLSQKHSHFADYYDIDLAIAPNSESAKSKKALMKHLLKAVDTESHAPVLFTILPSSRDLTKNLGLNHTTLSLYPQYKTTNLVKPIIEACSEYQLNCLDFTELFKQNKPESLYFKINDDHWNHKAQALAARETVDNILTLLNKKK